MRKLGFAFFCACALAARASPVPFGPGFVRGIYYPSPSPPGTEYGTPGCRELLKAVRAAGATAVALGPHYLVGRESPFALAPYPGSADRDALKRTIQWAREDGLEVHLRPQVLTHAVKRRFHLRIEHREDWKELFATLDTLLRDLGALGRDGGVRVLSIGTRLEEASRVTPENWRTLIARVREVFPGLITYDADWRAEVGAVPFWGELDVISLTLNDRVHGVDLEDGRPSERRLRRQMHRPTARLSELWYRHRKPVWVSELSFTGVSPELTARALRAALSAHQDRRWLSGVVVRGAVNGQPAWEELKRWFAPGPARSKAYYDEKDLVPWVDDWF